MSYKYCVEYYVKGVEKQVLGFNTLKECHADMLFFIDEDKQKLNKAGYKRRGSLKSGYIEYSHPILGVDSYVKVREQ